MLNNPISTRFPDRFSPKEKGRSGDEKSSPPITPPMSPNQTGGDRGRPGDEGEADERDAIQNETSYATRQTIPQARMVAGLLLASRSP